MSEAVQIAMISALSAGYVATIPLLFSVRRHAKSAATQTKNGHVENLRDDLDLVIVGVHRLQQELGVEDTAIRERAQRAKNRRSM